jgi:hypothetical protein
MYSKPVAAEFVAGLLSNLPSVPAQPNACFLHVRRGDYVGHPLLWIDLFARYYSDAIAVVKARVPDVKFIVFSNDITWCQKQPLFAAPEFEFEGESDPLRSLALMASCAVGGICANSSFSWWGAFLNTNPTRVVTFPRKWFNNSAPVDIYFSGSNVLDV